MPNTGDVPPAGSTNGRDDVHARATRPSAASSSTSAHNAEKWYTSTIAAIGDALGAGHRGQWSTIARWASGAKPPSASTRRTDGAIGTVDGRARPLTLPLASEAT